MQPPGTTRNRALVIGASGGIGGALASALEHRGHEVRRLSRSGDGLDLLDEPSIEQAAAGLPGEFRLILVATGALTIAGRGPEKTIMELSQERMQNQLLLNAVGPALVFKHFHHLLPRRGRSVLAVLSARVGSIGDNRLGGWISYRAAKAALNQVVRTTAIELARIRRDAICVALHPGTVATALSQPWLGRHAAVSPQESAQHLVEVIDQLERGDSGGFFAWDGQPICW